MIKILNFKQANQLYKQQMLDYRLLQDQAAVMLGVCQIPYSTISNSAEISQADIDWLMQQTIASQDYVVLLGGDANVCETEEDLMQIHGCDFVWAETHEGNCPNVTEIAMTWDVCHYLEETLGDPQWTIFLLCWNNAGGPVYYVPKRLWVQARVSEHIDASNPTFRT